MTARAILLVALLGLGACQATPRSVPATASLQGEAGIGRGTQRLVIDYLITHGMAESYVMSGRATAADLLDLVRYDHAALAAIRAHETAPSWHSLARATSAVRALLDYTATKDVAPAASPPA